MFEDVKEEGKLLADHMVDKLYLETIFPDKYEHKTRIPFTKEIQQLVSIDDTMEYQPLRVITVAQDYLVELGILQRDDKGVYRLG